MALNLPEPGTPLIHNGVEVLPSTDKVETPSYEQLPNGQEAIKELSRIRRVLSDLPATPKDMNAIGVILFYQLSGISDADISVATGVDVRVIRNIKDSPAYKQSLDTMISHVMEIESNDVRNLLAKNAKGAAQRVVDVAEALKGSPLGFAADKEILDRSGHSVKTIVEHQHKMQGGLVIRHVSADSGVNAPIIDVTPSEEIH